MHITIRNLGIDRYVRRRHFGGFFVFFQDLCDFVIHCNKRHIYLCFLFFLLTITGRNEAIIVELNELFVLNGTFITCSGGSHY